MPRSRSGGCERASIPFPRISEPQRNSVRGTVRANGRRGYCFSGGRPSRLAISSSRLSSTDLDFVPGSAGAWRVGLRVRRWLAVFRCRGRRIEGEIGCRTGGPQAEARPDGATQLQAAAPYWRARHPAVRRGLRRDRRRLEWTRRERSRCSREAAGAQAAIVGARFESDAVPADGAVRSGSAPQRIGARERAGRGSGRAKATHAGSGRRPAILVDRCARGTALCGRALRCARHRHVARRTLPARRARYSAPPRCRSGRRSSAGARHCRAAPARGGGARRPARHRSRQGAAGGRVAQRLRRAFRRTGE